MGYPAGRRATPGLPYITMRTALLASLLLCSAASAQGLDDFDSGTNPNGWAWNGFVTSVVEPTGGNPNGWLHGGPGMFANYPILRSGASAGGPWVGDYRANQVSEIRFDAKALGGPSGSGPMTLVLVDDRGTATTGDDQYAYYIDPVQTSPPAGAWFGYALPVPSADTSALPAGWQSGNGGSFGNGFSAGYDWNDLIQSVDGVEIHFSDPTWFYITQTWEMGVDNLEVVYNASFTMAPPTPAVAGQLTTLSTANGTPGGQVIFAYSLALGTTVANCGGSPIVAGIQAARLGPVAVADGAGASSTMVLVPANAAGLTVHLIALDRPTCTLSNIVSQQF